MTALGYIRVSRVHDESRTISPEAQRQAIGALARAHDDELRPDGIFEDLDVSGRRDRTRRPGWDALLSAVESGEASSVYGYSLSRFARTVPQVLDFFRLCQSRNVPVRMVRDSIDTSSATGRMTLTILAAVAEMEADVASERVRDAFARKASADPTWKGPGNLPYGGLPGEDPQVVVAAFREAGSFDGAARVLNARGWPARRKALHDRDPKIGKVDAVWHGSTVAGVVRHADPDAILPNTRRGAQAGPARDYRLARVLACGQCGATLTPSFDKRRGETRYYCARAKVTPHGRAWVSERVVLPIVATEAERAALLVRRSQRGSRVDVAEAERLAAVRGRWLEQFAEGLIDKPTRDARLADIARAEAKLSTRRWMRNFTRPPLIFDAEDADGVVQADPPAVVNGYIRRLFDRVVVEDMVRPARRGPAKEPPTLTFEWRDPGLRGEVSA